ncbi:TBC1 domain family member 2B-like [Sarcoptes scabiei]|uniref:Proteasome assembly chaperone 2 n=1 Tax=Sarcoptes scabiei TaxID=52283 RepID=A0A834REX2_SARSC|nr:TBC1 domain family member 2B-like [Sarcoptes scabiei]
MRFKFIPIDSDRESDQQLWQDYVLIWPCVSVGNVPQLAIDLLINHLLEHPDEPDNGSAPKQSKDLRLAGYIHSEYVKPFAGPDPFKSFGSLLSTSIQVFVSDSLKLVVVQQRSPLNKEYRNEFQTELSNWLSLHQFKMILLLSSSFNHFLAPEFFDANPFLMMSLVSESIDPSVRDFIEKKLSIKPVPKLDPLSKKPSPVGKYCLSGSGSALSFMKHFTFKNPQTPIISLFLFCSEGDNRKHSTRMVDDVVRILNEIGSNIIFPSKLSEPFSWRSMFGDEPPTEIY